MQIGYLCMDYFVYAKIVFLALQLGQFGTKMSQMLGLLSRSYLMDHLIGYWLQNI